MSPSISANTAFFRKELKSFLSSETNFKIIYQTHQNIISPTTLRVLVLDSSFNPPHKAHASLILQSIRNRYDDKLSIADTRINSIILLLSVKNADKTNINPASFEQRLTMMKCLADELGKLETPVGIGLTNKSLFVDKSELLHDYCVEELVSYNIINHSPKLTFLLGFDTLIRVLNPVYYKEEMKKALKSFFDRSECFVLFRNDGKIEMNDQAIYIKDLKNGGLDGIPKEWANKIHIGQPDESALNISSSEIRKLVKNGNIDWRKMVFPDIGKFIEEQKLYLD